MTFSVAQIASFQKHKSVDVRHFTMQGCHGMLIAC